MFPLKQFPLIPTKLKRHESSCKKVETGNGNGRGANKNGMLIKHDTLIISCGRISKPLVSWIISADVSYTHPCPRDLSPSQQQENTSPFLTLRESTCDQCLWFTLARVTECVSVCVGVKGPAACNRWWVCCLKDRAEGGGRFRAVAAVNTTRPPWLLFCSNQLMDIRKL